jgi:hypothetical protein
MGFRNQQTSLGGPHLVWYRKNPGWCLFLPSREGTTKSLSILITKTIILIKFTILINKNILMNYDSFTWILIILIKSATSCRNIGTVRNVSTTSRKPLEVSLVAPIEKWQLDTDPDDTNPIRSFGPIPFCSSRNLRLFLPVTSWNSYLSHPHFLMVVGHEFPTWKAPVIDST